MTKRRNPFDENYVLQKMHIGVKEVNLGVNHVENMKKVYENTMKMLYNGSVKNQNGMLNLQHGIFAVQNGMSTIQNGMPAIQNRISPFKNGLVNGYDSHLQHKIIEKNSVASDKQDKGTTLNPCCISNMKRHCSFCERIVCLACQRLCQNCHYEFCHLCSILQYDSQEETAICLSCI